MDAVKSKLSETIAAAEASVGPVEVSLEDLAFAHALRAQYLAMIPLAGAPDRVDSVRDFSIPVAKKQHQIPVRLYVPDGFAQRTGLPIILFFHGGGYVSGDLDTHDVMVRALANRSEALLLSVAWRLAPEYPFPAGLEDAITAVEWVAANAAEIGGDSQRIAVCGDSAGGALAASVTIAIRDRGGPPLAGQLLFYPSVGNGMETSSWKTFGEGFFPTSDVNGRVRALYVANDVNRLEDPLVSPILAELNDLPPAFVAIADHDPLKDEGRAYTEKLLAAGVDAAVTEYSGAAHAFVQFFKDRNANPQGEPALDDGATFLRARFASLLQS